MRRVLTALVGGLLVAVGVVLLVLPGPGFLVIAAGFAVLAREFTWARRPLDYARRRGQQALDQVSRSWLFAALDAAAGLVLIGVPVADLVANLPFLDVYSDPFIIASGLFLVGSVFYARRHKSVGVGS